ncbi:hypothetical protein Tco_0789760 [Tanacetum coccineum]
MFCTISGVFAYYVCIRITDTHISMSVDLILMRMRYQVCIAHHRYSGLKYAPGLFCCLGYIVGKICAICIRKTLGECADHLAIYSAVGYFLKVDSAKLTVSVYTHVAVRRDKRPVALGRQYFIEKRLKYLADFIPASLSIILAAADYPVGDTHREIVEGIL